MCSQTRILCTKCGFPLCYCKCGTVTRPVYSPAFDFTWSAATTPDPYGWGIIATAQHCQHRKGEACSAPFTEENRKCAREGCPMLPENFKELFHD